MNAIVAALMDDPAILALNTRLLVQDVCERFGVTRQAAYAAIFEAIRTAKDADVMPLEFAA